MVAELFGDPSVVDHGERRTRHTPEVNVHPVVRDDMSVSGSVGPTNSTVIEFEAISMSGSTEDDLEFMAVEVSVVKHKTSPLLFLVE